MRAQSVVEFHVRPVRLEDIAAVVDAHVRIHPPQDFTLPAMGRGVLAAHYRTAVATEGVYPLMLVRAPGGECVGTLIWTTNGPGFVREFVRRHWRLLAWSMLVRGWRSRRIREKAGIFLRTRLARRAVAPSGGGSGVIMGDAGVPVRTPARSLTWGVVPEIRNTLGILFLHDYFIAQAHAMGIEWVGGTVDADNAPQQQFLKALGYTLGPNAHGNLASWGHVPTMARKARFKPETVAMA